MTGEQEAGDRQQQAKRPAQQHRAAQPPGASRKPSRLKPTGMASSTIQPAMP
jgi:hypothetical protein